MWSELHLIVWGNWLAHIHSHFLQTGFLIHRVSSVLTPGILGPTSLPYSSDSNLQLPQSQSMGILVQLPSLASAALFLPKHCSSACWLWSWRALPPDLRPPETTTRIPWPSTSWGFQTPSIPTQRLQTHLTVTCIPREWRNKEPHIELLPQAPSLTFPTRTRRKRFSTSFLISWVLFWEYSKHPWSSQLWPVCHMLNES